MRMISLLAIVLTRGPHRRRRVERKSALGIGARKIPLAVRGFLVRAEDFLVTVHAADAVAFGRIISSRALLGILRRVNKHVPLLERIAVELDVDEAVVVVVGVIPAR